MNEWLEVRALNTFYGTHYSPRDLDAMPECDIREALEYARMGLQRDEE